ncbi:mitogen-activated protein kinase kinase kinase 17-like isoform X2 [Notolabrus celidotus]|uniref:mitogen-activated protein kinase kinase kinase 17-like isoform X2 n=1 Tax=Notolabrus celidotus TaxID=1203425 RepID=UPI00148FDD73|nr:mitogen-activated protein kinase kinase kinase 17-like isoform X2 [Notolabrus celidotus]
MHKVKEYEDLKRELENGELTQKGFDAKVKKLLVAEETDDVKPGPSNTFLSAAEAFGKAKKLLQPQVKKKQFPLCEKLVDHGKSLVKIRMAPMEWKPRTKKRSGHYQKLIMEETPPRLILKGHETYDDLVNTGKNSFWPDEIEGSEFTLCHVDGTRWTKEDFYKEFKTVSDIPNPWKRTLYIGRREIEVVCLGDGSCTLDEIPETGVNDCESGDLDEIPETGVAEDVADKLEGDDASFIALDLSMAVEYIHSQSIIHQDIKPANVMVHHPSKKAVLTDWGLANIRDTVMLRKGSRFTTEAVGPTGGTYLYMAPECLLNFEEASWQTDMWSLGVTFLELLTGSVPWVVNKQRELAALLVIKTPPHALAHLSERYSYLSGLVDYEASSRPTASDVVQLIKSGLDLSGRYGYSW